MYRPGRYHQVDKDYEYLSKTTMILRENNNAFLDNNWVPLIDSGKDKLHINKWHDAEKTIYTVLNMEPDGFDGPLLEVQNDDGYHYVSLWHHKELKPVESGNKYLVDVSTDPYYGKYEGTRLEGSLDCIARLPEIITVVLQQDSLYISSNRQGMMKIWNGNPSYHLKAYETEIDGNARLDITEVFPGYEGKIVIQLFTGKSLADETVVEFKGGRPWLISEVEKTEPHKGRYPRDMVLIPAAEISYTPVSYTHLRAHET